MTNAEWLKQPYKNMPEFGTGVVPEYGNVEQYLMFIRAREEDIKNFNYAIDEAYDCITELEKEDETFLQKVIKFIKKDTKLYNKPKEVE